MARFNVTFQFHLELLYIAIVDAPRLPAKVDFATYEELRQAMDALGHKWALHMDIRRR